MLTESSQWLAPFLGRRKRWVALLFLGLVGAVYANVLTGEFLWDDEFLITRNAWVQNPADWPRFFLSGIGGGSGVEYASYRPLQMLSYGIDSLLWGLNPFGFHLSNILLHWAVALVLYRWLRDAFGRPGLAVLTAMLFCLHPLHTEAVSYISGRADILSALFLLLTLNIICNPRISHRRTVILSLITYTLALLSREGSLVLPALVWLVYRRRDERPDTEIMTGLLIISGFYVLLRFYLLTGMVPTAPEFHTTVWQRLPGAFAAFGQYGRVILWPFDLHMEHGKTVFHWGQQAVILGAGLMALTIGLIFLLPRTDREIRFGLAWFVITLLPVLNIYPLNAWFAEHWVYLPFVGVALVMAEAFLFFADPVHGRWASVMIVLLLGGVTVFWGMRTIQQNLYWQNPVYFYRRTIWYAPNSYRLYFNLGNLYFVQDDNPSAAVGMYRQAIALKPDFAGSYQNLGQLYAKGLQATEARYWLEEALARNPRLGAAYVTLIELAHRAKDAAAIAEYCRRAEDNGQIGLVRESCPVLPRSPATTALPQL